MSNYQQNQFLFLDRYQAVVKQSISEGSDLLEEANNWMAPWHILVSYLFEQDKVNADRVQPLLEVIGGSPVSIYLAASGAYREAITVLRPLLEMVLLEWYCESVIKDDPSEREKFRVLYTEYDFNPHKGVPQIDHGKLFYLKEVESYRQFIQSNADTETAYHLLQYVDITNIRDLRRILTKYVHAHPAIYNIVQGTFGPFQDFNRKQLEWWLDLFRQVHGAIALWIQFIYPMILIWSRYTMSDQFPWLKSNNAHRMDVYWSGILHPLQIEFFAKGL